MPRPPTLGTISGLLFRLARNGLVGCFVRFGFAHLSALLPARRVYETDTILAFHHPRPSWKPHILFVPKVSIPTVLDIRPQQVPLVRSLIQRALETPARQRLAGERFALLVNGGAYQDVMQLHFHLAGWSDQLLYDCPDDTPDEIVLETKALTAFHHPRPARDVHVVLRARAERAASQETGTLDGAFVEDAIIATQALASRLGLATVGYTLLTTIAPGQSATTPCFHLVSGNTTETSPAGSATISYRGRGHEGHRT